MMQTIHSPVMVVTAVCLSVVLLYTIKRHYDPDIIALQQRALDHVLNNKAIDIWEGVTLKDNGARDAKLTPYPLLESDRAVVTGSPHTRKVSLFRDGSIRWA
ncbi:hypothetical protein SARC_01688 [Sphaeroforma arctica JP610]|uniref:Uncharacterized protein n=1 Tax=Sphaeroforma arctica JP610 TaxID=667725 RepID=A0A0L0GAX7_9EUKA|nr:hypothetical protein SARC_01688 [Sphaeroforma arctica JP610]KNC86162.1 hypothetical protein SARC_01688 [Sphaeroforma arctica JP610]|eukprot:XP_014160064.1 hypothetical protein SARC_01688 [Sphaeroforma arctica JP610]